MAIEDDDVRVGTPERERAITLINDAFSAGYLDIGEFEERSGAIYTARTRGDLRVLVADLPAGAQLFPDTGAAVAAASPAPGVSPRLSLSADWDTVRRKGSWQVPPRVLATGSMGTIDLDVRTAVFQAPVTEIELQVSATTVKLRVGPDHDIRVSDVHTSGWSSVKDKAGAPARPGGPVIVLTGSLSAASSLVLKR